MSAHDEFETVAPASVVVSDGKVHLVQGGEVKLQVSGAKIGGKSVFTLKQGEPLDIEFNDGEKAVITEYKAPEKKNAPEKNTPADK